MTWFYSLTGVPEFPREKMLSQVRMEGTKLVTPNGEYEAGEFTTPTLADLRQHMGVPEDVVRKSKIKELVADVSTLHCDPTNRDAVFQVASQFNCLEMVAPYVTPEEGVGIYEDDRTQGPACSICCGAGTIFRNYFVDINGASGQSSDNQIDCLSSVGKHFGNPQQQHWRMRNGYCFPSKDGLSEIEMQLAALSKGDFDEVRGKLRVGVQSQTEVTTSESRQLVTQVFCSALPIRYSDIPNRNWDLFPRLILEATYEMTFYVALQNMKETGSNQLFLTLVGGGVFGNKLEWILSAIERAFGMFADCGFDVTIVSYGKSNPAVVEFAKRLNCDA